MPATIDGILGGYEQISNTDIEGSKAFLHKVLTRQTSSGTKLALDCGAGIGRITKHVLIPCFEMVELVEQNEKFINTAIQWLGEDNNKLGAVYEIGLQYFKPQKQYDVIWCQWVLGHLNDYDLISFLERCGEALADNGVIILKENITLSDEVEYDNKDSAVTRPYDLLKRILKMTFRLIFQKIFILFMFLL